MLRIEKRIAADRDLGIGLGDLSPNCIPTFARIRAGVGPFGRLGYVGGGWFEKKKVPIGRARRRFRSTTSCPELFSCPGSNSRLDSIVAITA